MDALTTPLRVTGVQRAPSASLLIVTTNRPAAPEEAAGVHGTLKVHVNGDLPIGHITHETAQAMLRALRLALPELVEDLEALVESNTPNTPAWSSNQPLPPDLDEDVRLTASDKKAALDAVRAAILQAEGSR